MKVKPERTADCVVVGVRWKSKPDRIATLLLGLYRKDGEIDYVGSAAVAPARHGQVAERVLPLLAKAPERRFSEPNRWGGGELEESPVRPELVVEVRYDKVQSNRFRHGTKLIRFRDDKEPEQCTWRELRPARRRSDSVDSSSAPDRSERGEYATPEIERADVGCRCVRWPTPRHMPMMPDGRHVLARSLEAAHHLGAPADEQQQADHGHQGQGEEPHAHVVADPEGSERTGRREAARRAVATSGF